VGLALPSLGPPPPGLASGAGNPVGVVDGGRLLSITFLGEARKVISRRAAPGNKITREAHKTLWLSDTNQGMKPLLQM
ncbi:MAG: hypothetical protein Q8K43_01600, partial [Sulfurimicrobium sp.]|nr:hypothetical protein [Sulfurimicrobium sp.]